VFWVIPRFGLFGLVWTALVAVIGGWHARRLLR